MIQHSNQYYRNQINFNDRFPLAVVAVLATIQLLITLIIIGLEVGHILYGIRLANLFAGFWVSVPFTFLWISMFATGKFLYMQYKFYCIILFFYILVCCCRQRSCATNAFVQNLISFIFAMVLVGINATFIRRPDDCYFGTKICNDLSMLSTSSSDLICLFDETTTDCRKTRVSLIKAQLAAAIVMALTCFTYIIIYFVVNYKASRATRRQERTAVHAVMAPVYQSPVASSTPQMHQPFQVSSNPYAPSAPFSTENYQQYSTQMPSSISNGNYLTPIQEPILYPRISNDRF